MTLEEIKLFLRVDGDLDDSLINTLQLTAEEYLDGAGITKNYMNNRYGLCVMILIKNWYDNREITIEGKSEKDIPFGIRSMIQQLQLELGL